MRKAIFAFVVSLVVVVPIAVRASVPEGVAYLKTQVIDDWSAQALVAAGETSIDVSSLQTFTGSSATDHAKRILALVAVGEEPRTYTGTDLVARLNALASGGQIGDATLLNDDAWGIIALRAAGVAASDSVVTGAKSFLLSHQGADGGWGYDVFSGSDTNDTAAVLMALSEVGFTSGSAEVVNAVAFLTSQQQPDGGWPYVVPCAWPGCTDSDSASTAWVLSAFTKLGLTPSGSPADFINSLQTSEGSFKWQASDLAGSAGMTSYALVALAGKYYPVKRLVISGAVGGGGYKVDNVDLVLSINMSKSEVTPHTDLTFTLALKNNGPDAAVRPVVTGLLFGGNTYVIAKPSGGIFDPILGSWAPGALYPREQATLQITLRSGTAGEYVYTFVATNTAAEVNQADNQVKLTIVVSEPVLLVQEQEIALPQVLGVQTSTGCTVPASTLGTVNPGGVALGSRDGSAIWYLEPTSNISYCLFDDASVRNVLERFSLGITNADLASIPVGDNTPLEFLDSSTPNAVLSARLEGRLVLQVESVGEAWYITGGKRYYLSPTVIAIDSLRRFVH